MRTNDPRYLAVLSSITRLLVIVDKFKIKHTYIKYREQETYMYRRWNGKWNLK